MSSTGITGGFDPDTVNAIAAVANVAVAALALLVAAVSIRLSRQSLAHQQRHNRLSVTPIPYIRRAHYEIRLEVAIKNNGAGPLIIKSVNTFDGETYKEDLISWMPKPPTESTWEHFSMVASGRSVLPGEELILIKMKGKPDDDKFIAYRDACRVKLSKLIIELEYTDIYGTVFPLHRASLASYARKQLKVFDD